MAQMMQITEARSVNRRQMKPLYLAVSGGSCENEDDLVNVKRRSILPSMMSWYMSNMEKHELATKCLSTGCLAMFGDVCAQGIGQYLANGNPFANKLDKLRMIAMFADGTLCTGPLLHYAYELYEKVWPIYDSDGNRRLLPTLAHVLFDNFIMIVAYISLMMFSTALVEGRYQGIPHEFTHDLIPNIKTSYKASVFGLMWIQLISFYWLPVKLRVLAVNVIDIVWVIVMSFVTHLNRH
ncbi:hypothetical protein ACHAWC_008955 [Mediolabrus comicus]